MKNKGEYLSGAHRVGRIGSLLAIATMLGTPLILCAVYDCFPSFSAVVQAALPLLMFMLPADFSEIIAFAPILGSASYITFITGNVQNLKLPVVISAQQIAQVQSNTEESDAISSMAVALSSIETLLIMVLGMLMITPLEPILTAPAMQTATKYMIPALFGCLSIGLFSHGKNQKYMKNKLLLFAIPAIVTVLAILIFPSVLAYQGFVLIGGILITIGAAYLLYKRGIIKFIEPENSKSQG